MPILTNPNFRLQNGTSENLLLILFMAPYRYSLSSKRVQQTEIWITIAQVLPAAAAGCYYIWRSNSGGGYSHFHTHVAAAGCVKKCYDVDHQDYVLDLLASVGSLVSGVMQ